MKFTEIIRIKRGEIREDILFILILRVRDTWELIINREESNIIIYREFDNQNEEDRVSSSIDLINQKIVPEKIEEE